MKKSLIAVCLTAAMALAANAGDAEHKDGGKAKHEGTADQHAVIKELLEKYDTNKNGKLDQSEHAKMSAEDKEKWEKARPTHHKSGKDAKAKESNDKETK
jgi:hypothetical protein